MKGEQWYKNIEQRLSEAEQRIANDLDDYRDIAEHNAELRRQVQALRKALEAVEWINVEVGPQWDADKTCPWCNGYMESGHESDCLRQAALASTRDVCVHTQEDGCCGHPGNMTPECTRWACPEVQMLREALELALRQWYRDDAFGDGTTEDDDVVVTLRDALASTEDGG